MAETVIEGIEKDFYLKESYDGGTPLSFRHNRQGYVLKVASNPDGPLILQADRPVAGLKPGSRMELLFERQGTKIQFSVEAARVRGNYITAAREVEALRKGLKRSYARVAAPAGLDPGDAAAGASVTAGLATTAILTGLRNGTIYHVRVKAVNAYGSAVSVRKAGYPYDPALPGDIASKNQPPAAFVSDWANLSYGDKYAITAGAVSYDYGYSNYPADFTGDVKYVSEYGSKGVIIIEYTIPPGKPYTDANTPASNFRCIGQFRQCL